jgi:two-component system sensor histidine kinase YesM
MKLEKLVRKVNVRTRLLAAFLCVSIIPSITIGIYAYQAYERSTYALFTESSIQSVQQLGATLSAELARYSQLIDMSSINPIVQSAMEMREGGAVLRNATADIITTGGYFRGFRIADVYGNVLYDAGRLRINEAGFGGIIAAIDTASPKDSLYYLGGTPVGTLAIGRKIFKYPVGTEHIGYIITFTDTTMISDRYFSGAALDGDIILMSKYGMVLSSNIAIPGSRLDDEHLFERIEDNTVNGAGSFSTVWNGISSVVVFSNLPQYDVVLLSIIPNSLIDAETRPMQIRLILLVIGAALLCLLLSVWIWKSVSAPIVRIVQNLSATDIDPIDDTSPDDIGFLARAIDKYTADLKEMAKMQMDEQRKKREFELASLQYQINPHFLFNTLGSLKFLAVLNNAPSVISDGITSLSRLLRNVLLSGDEFVPISEELDNLAHYLAIQQIRYADNFIVVEEISENVLSTPIPRFILQPLVENSVLHSLEPDRRVLITIRSISTRDGVLLEIEDDGVGFDTDSIENVSNKKFTGIGISNVDERLKLYYGEAYGLKIISKPGEGTICRVVIPYDGD